MADSSIFDDFEEPVKMSRAFCEQVSAQEYSESVTSETDRALGDLCLLLDKEPELYARVLRKRKREEIESEGVFSFMKSKVVGLVQGDEKYTKNLVTDVDCLRKTIALKAGICRTFQYAQEIKNEPVRQSQRQASKIASQRIEKARPHKNKTEEHKSMTLSTNGVEKITRNDCGDGQLESDIDGSLTMTSTVCDKNDNGTFVEISLSTDEEGTNHIDSSAKCKDELSGNAKNYDKGENLHFDIVPPPPGPPPPPSPLPSHVTTPNILQNLAPTVKKETDSNLMPSQSTPEGLQTISSDKLHCSTTTSGLCRRNAVRSHKSKSDLTLSNSNATLDNAKSDGRKLRSQTTHSGSMTSLSSIHSELISSNPVSRLRGTSVVRSPGGTQLKPAANSHLSSEPLHNALVTAVRSKFKNVHTPSPRSAYSSANNSEQFTFSP